LSLKHVIRSPPAGDDGARELAPPAPLVGSAMAAAKNEMIKAERRILKELGFCVHLQHPHKVS